MLSRLVACLSGARDFETASSHLLVACFDVLTPILREEKTASDSRVLRGTIHFRPEDGYRRLWTREFDSTQPASPVAQQPSLTAWRWVARRRCPVSIDVDSHLLRIFEGGPPRLVRDTSDAAMLNASGTCQRLRAREVNYLYVLPIRKPGNLTDGMVSLEMSCPSEIGDRVATNADEVLQLLVDLAAPYLAALPLAPSATRPEVDEFLPVIGKEMAGVVDLLQVFSGLEETILISGCTGVGKSRLARYCHAHSSRRNKPFVTLDLLACPENLKLAQLVGWKKGAFTGADKDSPGAIQRAEGGTLFLDEIDKLPLNEQASLLRLLEERAYRPVGDTGEDRRADVRFIVGTNTDLPAAMNAGRFREDLYYRIAVLMVTVPPLAQRIDEVPVWAQYMLRRCAVPEDTTAVDSAGDVWLEPEAVEVLQGQTWPGNLRQLDNVIRRAYAYCLLDSGLTASGFTVTRAHIERAVAEDSAGQSSRNQEATLLRQIRAAARAYAREVKRRANTDAPLLLEWADAFRGFVLDSTVKRFGSKEAAFDALGLGSAVKDRNHHRIMKQQLKLVASFIEFLEKKTGTGPELPNEQDDAGTSSRRGLSDSSPQ